MCRWALMAMLVAAAPADGAQVIAPRDVAAAPADAAQVIAPRDVAAALAVAGDGRAFVVSPSARPDSGTLRAVRRRTAPPGAAFGSSHALMRSAAATAPWTRASPPTAAA